MPVWWCTGVKTEPDGTPGGAAALEGLLGPVGDWSGCDLAGARQWFEVALTHRSFANEQDPPAPDNQRLEFLGDAVIGAVVAAWLFETHPDLDQGRLTRLRSDLVSAPRLAGLARRLGLGRFLRLGRGEEMSRGRQRDSVLADAFEALVGALFLAVGLEGCRRFIERAAAPELARAVTGQPWRDNKTELQERLQRRGLLPAYHVVRERGPDHAKEFFVEVLVDGVVSGRGQGRNKKEAEQEAAAEALADMAGREEP